MVQSFEREKLKKKIESLLKDPWDVDEDSSKKMMGLHFSSKNDDFHLVLEQMIEKEKNTHLKTYKNILQLKNFKKFMKFLFSYLDEIYYIEKKKRVLNEEKIKIQILEKEIERINLKAKKMSHAYTALVYNTVWRKKVKWEKIINFICKLVKKVYKKEDNYEIIEVHRVMRTSSFNKSKRERVQRALRSKMNKDLSICIKSKNKNIDVMMRLMKMRGNLQNEFNTKLRKNYNSASYRPYFINSVPLKAKNSNSVLLSTILPVVKDKKIVEYRIQDKKRNWKRVRLDRRRIGSMIDKDFDRLREQQNVSAHY